MVPESTSEPYDYYLNNVGKSLELFRTLNRLGQKRVVFSSSAAIYDVVPGFMVTEESPLKPVSPYARTKYMMEMVLKDFLHCLRHERHRPALLQPDWRRPTNAFRHPC